MPAKKLIVCFDGTWNAVPPQFGADLTNAARIADLALPRDADGFEQLVCYIPGIGTDGWLDYFKNGYTGQGLPRKIREGCRFLAENYAEGDEIFLFGVSRGAFAARTLADWLGWSGLPPGSVIEAWRDYRDQRTAETAAPTPIRFLGVWDMVDALGLPLPLLRELTRPKVGRRPPLVGAHVETVRHALAVDETRVPYQPTLFQTPPSLVARVRQTWFVGTHGDVCGGFGKRALADIPLGWMIDEARRCGLAFDQERVRDELQPNLDEAPSEDRTVLRFFCRRRPRKILELPTERIHPTVFEKMRREPDRYPVGPPADLLQRGDLE